MSINTYKKTDDKSEFAQFKRLHPESILTFELWLKDVKNLNRDIRTGAVKFLSIEELKDSFECKECHHLKPAKDYIIEKNGYRQQNCRDCRNKLKREQAAKKRKEMTR